MSVSSINKTFISSEGTFHVRDLREGGTSGDFGNSWDYKEVYFMTNPEGFTSGDVIYQASGIIPDQEVHSFCEGEYFLNGTEGTFDSYEWNPSDLPLGEDYVTFSSGGTTLLLRSKGDSSGSTVLTFGDSDVISGYLRINGTLLISEDVRTFITRGGTVYTETLEEFYSYTQD